MTKIFFKLKEHTMQKTNSREHKMKKKNVKLKKQIQNIN